ncbi:MAG TPA: hypothetical protein P5081_00650 [Phycisphaerae bacterium]|nr:hypothetical protein [Phycisphaerae bacterium]HRW51363.1 hypothetical protein [Phycisphaerae bacterium]
MRWIPIVLIALVVGCRGPLAVPMVDRLDEKSQAEIDEVWGNMLTPPNGLDRELLLDVILSQQLHQHGVDSLRFISEKQVGEGLVVMEIRFDREDPLFDEFSVSYVDRRGRELRRERYSREDIDEEIRLLTEMSADASGEAGQTDELTEEQAARRAEREERARVMREVLEPLTRDGDEAEMKTDSAETSPVE